MLESACFLPLYPAGVTPSGELADQLRKFPSVAQAGFLLRRDEKCRWHRSWCKIDSKDVRFSIYDDNNEEVLVHSFTLENASVQQLGAQEFEKDHCFVISGITADIVGGSENENLNSDEIIFAAYSEAELRQWGEVLHLLTCSRESARNSFPYIDSSTSTSSSNFSSNRDSMISTTSSMFYAARNQNRADSPPRSKSLERDQQVSDEMKVLSLTKQQQPLPPPPEVSYCHGVQCHVYMYMYCVILNLCECVMVVRVYAFQVFVVIFPSSHSCEAGTWQHLVH